MSALPDPAELAPTRDPAAYGRRPIFTATFFAWIALCILCLVAGVAMGKFGVPLTPTARVEPAPADTSPRTAAPAAPIALPQPAVAPDANAGGSADVSALADRVARLESSSSHGDAAATAALAAADLSQAAQSSASFGQDVAAYQQVMPASADLAALAPLAARGAPSRADLAASLPPLASDAAAAARQPAKNAGLFSRLMGWIGKVVVIRRIDLKAPGVDGALARAEAQASAGDLEASVASLQTLPPAARPPLADWIAAAQRRIEIDHRIEAIRAEALADLAPPIPSAQGAKP